MINNLFSIVRNSSLRLANCFALLMGTVIFIIFIRQIIEGYEKESWNITEWLINYEAGFVRRGLVGQLIFDAYKVFNIDPYFLIIGICSLSYALLCFLIIRGACLKKIPLILLPTAYLLGGPVINDFWVRKDIFLQLCFIGALCLIRHSKRLPGFVAINVLCSVAVLCHEAFGIWAFLTLFISHALYFSVLNEAEFNLKTLIRSCGYFIPSIIVFLICAYYKGSAMIASEIWRSWESIPFPYNGKGFTMPPGSIEPLGWDLHEGITHYFYLIFVFSYGVYVPVGLVISIILVLLMVWAAPLIYENLAVRSKKGDDQSVSIVDYMIQRRILIRWLGIQMVTIVPLFIVGIDYGRWIFIWITNAVILYLFLPLSVNMRLVELTSYPKVSMLNGLKVWNKKISNIVKEKYYSFILYGIIYSFTGVSIISWTLREFLFSSPLGVLYQFVYFISNGVLYKMFG